MAVSLLRAILSRPLLLASPSPSPSLSAWPSPLPSLSGTATTITSSSSHRSFSSTPSSPLPLNAGPERKDTPAYPHGYARWYKKSNRGIYGATRVRVHKQVSAGFPSRRVLTRWWPNVHRKRLWSGCLERYVRVRVVIRVLRSIDKAGGLDRYLLGQSPGRVRELGPTGWALRWRLLRTARGVQMWEDERVRLGLPRGKGPRSEEWERAIGDEADRLRQDARRMVESGGREEDLADSQIEEEGDEQWAATREREIDDMLEREDRLGDRDEGGLDISEGSERDSDRRR